MTKTEQLFNYVKQQIKDGIYTPGDKFPGGRDFAESCHVSYITANNVLQRLEQEGLLTRYPRKGSFVAAPAAIPAEKNETFKEKDDTQ
jgi:DNA-binding GntR family transcriptional regulator